MYMFKKILELQDDILVLIGIYYAIRFIYTKEVYIQIANGYMINTLNLLIMTIALVSIHRAMEKETSKETKSIK